MRRAGAQQRRSGTPDEPPDRQAGESAQGSAPSAGPPLVWEPLVPGMTLERGGYWLRADGFMVAIAPTNPPLVKGNYPILCWLGDALGWLVRKMKR